MRTPASRKPLPRPHKRPSQARALFTVQALYDGFVRIWRRDGPAAATTRAIAEESGYAVGTLYDYFPNRDALLAGYVRHCLEDLCQRLHEADSAPGAWRERLRRLVAITLDQDGQAPYFDATMLAMEGQIADTGHHRRAFQLLCEAWTQRLAAWPDLPARNAQVVPTLVWTVWGARRYAVLLERDAPSDEEVARISVMLEALLLQPHPR
ncbi:TetR family transcriptional regulator [Alcanivorax sp. N3-2A]|nr:TetR family transcriptional regulator [Alcanivorax sp. N3-2A]